MPCGVERVSAIADVDRILLCNTFIVGCLNHHAHVVYSTLKQGGLNLLTDTLGLCLI